MTAEGHAPVGRAARATPLLDIIDLSKRQPNGTLELDHVSLQVYAGRLTVILGPDSRAKSTLVRCVLRLADPTAGTIVLNGIDLDQLDDAELDEMRKSIGVVAQADELVARRTALSNVAVGPPSVDRRLLLALGFVPRADRERALACLERVGMAHAADQRVDLLTPAGAQRVAIARALFHSPKLLIADEPLANLEHGGAHGIMELLADLAHTDGLGVVVLTHELSLARKYSDWVIGLCDARIVLDATIDDVDMTIMSGLYIVDEFS